MRAVGLLATGLIVLAGGALWISGRGSDYSYSGPAGPPFSFRYRDLDKTAPKPGELARFEKTSGDGLVRELTVTPVRLPARPNPVATTLPFAANGLEKTAAKEFAGFDQVVEGRTRLDILDGREAYMFGFTASGPGNSPDGHIWVGKTYLVATPGKAPSRAVAVQLLERVGSAKVAAALRSYPAGFLLSWPIRYWVQQDTSVDVPGSFERVLKSFAVG